MALNLASRPALKNASMANVRGSQILFANVMWGGQGKIVTKIVNAISTPLAPKALGNVTIVNSKLRASFAINVSKAVLAMPPLKKAAQNAG